MRKLISSLLTLCIAVPMTVASASTVGGNVRNGVTAGVTSYQTTGLPAFRPGDSVTFNLDGLTSGNEVTVISTKWVGGSTGNISEPTSSNVQYINQYTLDSTTHSFTYTVKEIEDGIYALRINDGTDSLVNLFYKVGSVDLSLIDGNGNTVNKDTFGAPYVIRDNGDGTYSIGFIAKATIDDSNVTFSDLDAQLGIKVKDSLHDDKVISRYFTSEQLEALDVFVRGHEVSGKFSVVYGLTVSNVTDEDAVEGLTAQPDMR